MHIDFGEKPKQSFGDVEPVLVVDEVFPLGMGIGGGGMLEGMLLPFVVLAAELDVGDERVEGDVVVVLLAVEGGLKVKLEQRRRRRWRWRGRLVGVWEIRIRRREKVDM